MYSILSKVSAVMQTLFSGELFKDPEGGPDIPLQFYIGALPEKRHDSAQGVDFPYCLVTTGAFNSGSNSGSLNVSITIGTYNNDIPENVFQDDLDRIYTKLLTVASNVKKAGVPAESETSGTFDELKKPYYITSCSIGCRFVVNTSC